MGMDITQKLLKLEKQEISESRFQIPSGYRIEESP
jgi:hypothetical protein